MNKTNFIQKKSIRKIKRINKKKLIEKFDKEYF